MGFEFQRSNTEDPNSAKTVQAGFHPNGKLFARTYNKTNGWSRVRQFYSEGGVPTSYSGHRPDGIGVGDMKFDTTKNKPVWWDGSKWILADGTAI